MLEKVTYWAPAGMFWRARFALSAGGWLHAAGTRPLLQTLLVHPTVPNPDYLLGGSACIELASKPYASYDAIRDTFELGLVVALVLM